MRVLPLAIALVSLSVRADDRADLAGLVELGPKGLPVVFEGATFGMTEAEVAKAWKRYDRELGGARHGSVLAAPLFDANKHVRRLVLYDAGDEAVRLAVLTKIWGKPMMTGDQGTAVWLWPDRQIRAAIARQLAIVLEPYRPLAKLSVDSLLAVAGTTIADAEKRLGAKATLTDDLVTIDLPATEFGSVTLWAHLRRRRLVNIRIQLDYPSGTTDALLQALRPIVGEAIEDPQSHGQWRTKSLELRMDELGSASWLSLTRPAKTSK